MPKALLFLFCALAFSTDTDKLSVSYSNNNYDYTDGIDEDYQVVAQYDCFSCPNFEQIIVF